MQIRRQVENHIKSTYQDQLSELREEPTNVYVLLDHHVDSTNDFSDLIRLNLALVYDFQEGIKFKPFTLSFNKKDIVELYNKDRYNNKDLKNKANYLKQLIKDVFAQLLSMYNQKEISTYMEKTSKGITVNQLKQQYKTDVQTLLICHRSFLKEKNDSDIDAYVNILGKDFKDHFKELNIRYSTILLRAIQLAAVGSISVVALKKIFDYYKSQKTPIIRSPSGTRRKNTKTKKRDKQKSKSRRKSQR